MTDNPIHINSIKGVINQTIVDAHTVDPKYRPTDHKHVTFMYCAGYLQACVHCYVISPEKYKELLSYVEERAVGL